MQNNTTCCCKANHEDELDPCRQKYHVDEVDRIGTLAQVPESDAQIKPQPSKFGFPEWGSSVNAGKPEKEDRI